MFQTYWLIKQRQFWNRLIRRFQRVSEHDLNTVTGQLAPILLQHSRESECGNRIRTNHNLEAVKTACKNIGTSSDYAGPLFLRKASKGLFDDPQ
ncbi:hypothetical protein WJ45_23080 [Burkholderia ubonensis]|nr:hypothetical protein WJ45_23080 [Burkholderia ubonensis]